MPPVGRKKGWQSHGAFFALHMPEPFYALAIFETACHPVWRLYSCSSRRAHWAFLATWGVWAWERWPNVQRWEVAVHLQRHRAHNHREGLEGCFWGRWRDCSSACCAWGKTLRYLAVYVWGKSQRDESIACPCLWWPESNAQGWTMTEAWYRAGARRGSINWACAPKLDV